MARSYLPQKLDELLTWAQNFSDLITASPSLYGLGSGDASAIAGVNDAYAAAYALSNAPGTRTSVTVAATVTARNTLVAVIRNYARIILANSGVADADKTDLGLIVRDPVNTPIPTPTTNPILGLIGITPGQLTMTFKDSASGAGVKAKPFGATQMQLFMLLGTVAPVSPAATPFAAVFTKTPFAVSTVGGAAGATAFMYARWINQKGQVGPWSSLLTSAIMPP